MRIEYFLLIILAVAIPEIVGENEYANMMFENSVFFNKNFNLQWKLDDDSIILKLKVHTLGYVSIGISPFEHPKSMARADIIVGGVSSDKTGYVIDSYAPSNTIPKEDTSHVTLLYANEENGHTTIIVKRKLAAQEEKDQTISAGPTGVLWAFGGQDVVGTIVATNYHRRNRGHATIDFFQNNFEKDVEIDKSESHKYDETHGESHASCVSDHFGDDNDMMPHYIHLDDESEVLLRWGVDGEYINFEMSAETKGWIGLGIAPGPDMTDADIAVMGVNPEGTYVFDCYSLYNAYPTVDESQDVEITGHMENGTHTTIKFKRKIISTDDEDRTIEKNRNYVIWAVGMHDIEDKRWSVNYHYKRPGYKILNLLHDGKMEPTMDDNDKTVTETEVHGEGETTMHDEESTDGVGEKAEGDKDDTKDGESTHGEEDEDGTETGTETGTKCEKPHSDHISGTVILGDDGNVVLQWSIGDIYIYIQITAPTTGWIGFGLSDDNTMKNADIVMAGLKDGKPYVFDMHGVSNRNTLPLMDQYQDVTILGAIEYERKTVVLLRRLVEGNTTEMGADRAFKKGKMNVIWAYGEKDIVELPNFRDYHSYNKANKLVEFIPEHTASTGEDTATVGSEHTATGEGKDTATGEGEDTATGEDEDTATGEGEDTATGESEDTATGESEDTATGESEDTATGEGEDTETGEGENTATGEGKDTATGKSEDIATGESEDTATGDGEDTATGEGEDTATGEGEDTATGEGENTATDEGEDTATDEGEDTATGEGEDTATDEGEDTATGKDEKTATDEGEDTATGEGEDTIPAAKVEIDLFKDGMHVMLDAKENVDLYWTYNDVYIVFKITAPTKGWIGFGISSQPNMAGADIVMTGARKNGPYVLELHGQSGKNGLPILDVQQDVQILRYSEIGKMTSVTFYRKINTMDINDKVITGDDIYVIWSYGKTDLAAKAKRFYHGRKHRGSLKMKLIDGPGNLPTSYKFSPAATVIANLKQQKKN